jgi:hypothetical protein
VAQTPTQKMKHRPRNEAARGRMGPRPVSCHPQGYGSGGRRGQRSRRLRGCTGRGRGTLRGMRGAQP